MKRSRGIAAVLAAWCVTALAPAVAPAATPGPVDGAVDCVKGGAKALTNALFEGHHMPYNCEL